jgi:hypothetical protein
MVSFKTLVWPKKSSTIDFERVVIFSVIWDFYLYINYVNSMNLIKVQFEPTSCFHIMLTISWYWIVCYNYKKYNRGCFKIRSSISSYKDTNQVIGKIRYDPNIKDLLHVK